MNKILFIISFGFFFSQAVFSQEKWSLTKCLEYAEKNNIQLQQLQLNKQLAEIDLKQSENNRLPTISGNTSLGYSFGRSIDPTSNEFREQNYLFNSLGLNANVLVFRGFQLKNTIAQNSLSVKSRELDIEAAKNDLGMNITSAYLAILQAQAQVNVLTEQEKTTEIQYQRTQKLIDAGVLPKGDILQIDAQKATDELNRITAENALERAYFSLGQILDYFEPINIEIPEVPVPSSQELALISPQEIYSQALTKMPEVKGAKMEVAIAEKSVELAKGGKMPTVSAFVGANSNYASILRELKSTEVTFNDTVIGFVGGFTGEPVVSIFPSLVSDELVNVGYFNQLNRNFSTNVGLNVTFPIFSQFSNNTNIKRAKLSVKTQELQLATQKNSLLNEIQSAYQDAKAAAKNYEATVKNMSALELAFKNIEKRYQLGASTIIDYNTAKNNLTIAQLNQNTAKYEYIFRLKILDFYQGKPLSF